MADTTNIRIRKKLAKRSVKARRIAKDLVLPGGLKIDASHDAIYERGLEGLISDIEKEKPGLAGTVPGCDSLTPLKERSST